MLITEFYFQRDDGVNLYKTYSDLHMFIERDGFLYEEAVDPENSGRVYTETDVPIPEEETENVI